MSVPWNDDAERVKELYGQARQECDAGRFAAAAALFHHAYELQPSAFAAARSIHCMRKQGAEQARAAVLFGREPVDQWPDEVWLIREYVWAVYEGYLKAGAECAEDGETPGEARQGFEVRVKAARRILKLSHEELPRRRAVFAICREAGARKQWPLVLEFALTLDREMLSDESQEQNGDTLPSPLQQWLYIMTRVHLELRKYEECMEYAREGMKRYPQVVFFPRWNALAQVRQGNVEVGLRELKQIDRRFAPQWYIKRDIAEACERLEKHEAAWHWFCAAAGSAGELKHCLQMLVQMAQLLERLERWPLALDHLRLVWSLSAREAGWDKAAEKNREQLEAFVQDHAGKHGLPSEVMGAAPDPIPLLARCQQAWDEARE